MSIGTTEAEFLRRYPLAHRQESGKWKVTAWYARLDRGHCVIQVECYQGRIFYIGVTFNPTLLFEMGGRPVLERKLTDALGLPASVQDDTSYWHFAPVDRKIGYRQRLDGGATVLIMDTAADRHRLAEQTTGSDIGF